MEGYKLNTSFDPNKVFIVKKSELENKMEVSYHLPEISDLEKKIRRITSKKLSDFILNLSSGATPSVDEEDKFYSNSIEGIPFIRVQNLQINGKLNLDDVKYINKETHEGYLKRSQVSGGDLLIKITGVGRMAIASVAPDNFIGNINQHIVVIKTESKQISEYLSNYLNLDFVEKLAKRRATGGTRPALDYPALKSIPIVENIDFSILKDAEQRKQSKEVEAKALLASIDTYLLKELGITLPDKKHSLENRIFITNFSMVSSGRLDAFYNDSYYIKLLYNLENSRYKIFKLNELIYSVSGVVYSRDDESVEGIKILRGNNITLESNELNYDSIRFLRSDFQVNDELKLKAEDIFISTASGSKEHVGKVVYIENDLDYYFGGFMSVFRKLKLSNHNQKYLFEFLQSFIFRSYLQRFLGGTNINNINLNMIGDIPIPLPPPEKQNEIANHIQNIRIQAKSLQEDAKRIFEQAKLQVEKMILE